MNPPVVIGIDPGLNGAVAAIDNMTGDLIWVEDMPTVGHSKDRVVSPAHLADLLQPELVTVACVEIASTRPGLSVSAVLKTGTGYGMILGVIAALRMPVTYAQPARWKKDLGLAADKHLSRKLATETWPAMSPTFARVRDDGRAEAALIARWAWQRARGER